MTHTFTATSGQIFSIEGLNDELALADALAHTEAGRPFGRWNMRRLENTYGVKVAFVEERIMGVMPVYCDGLDWLNESQIAHSLEMSDLVWEADESHPANYPSEDDHLVGCGCGA